MLRIAMISDYSDFDDKVDGGVQAVTKYLVDELARHSDIDLHVISFKYDTRTSRSLRKNGYTRHVLPGAALGTLTAYWKDQRTLNRCLETIQPSVVHGQGAGHNGILASRSTFPSVVTIHGIMAEEAKFYGGWANRYRHRLMSRLSDRYCIDRARHTILISPYVAGYFNNRLSGKRYFIPNPISDDFFEIPRQEESGRLLFAGRLLPLKGVMDLVRATSEVAKSQRVELVLAGSLDDRLYVSQLKDEVTRLGIDRMVHFRGLLSEKELRDELGSCAALVLPSYQETAPMVIIEAMAAGVPVIASNVGGVSHQVKDGKTGFLVKPGDVKTISDRLNELLADASLRKAFGAAAKCLATEEYRAARVAKRTIDVYTQAIF